MLYEYWVVGTRPAEQNGFGIDAVVADAAMTAWLRRFLLLPDEQGIFSHWRSLVLGHAVKGKAAHDARLVASMLHHGVKNIVSFNKSDFSRFSSIAVHTPEEIIGGSMLA